MYELVFTDEAWRTVVRGLGLATGEAPQPGRGHDRVALCPLGLNRHQEGTALLVYRVDWSPPSPLRADPERDVGTRKWRVDDRKVHGLAGPGMPG